MRKREYPHLLQNRFKISSESKTGKEGKAAVIAASGKEIVESKKLES